MDTSNDIKIIQQQTVYSGFFDVIAAQLRFRLFNGEWSELIQRDYVRRRDAVGVLLYDPIQDAVILIEQFRVGATDDHDSPWLLEIVAGLVEDGEALEGVARREALEESNCTIQQLYPIADYYTSPGSSTEYTYLYCGLIDSTGAGGVYGLDEENEDIKVHVVSLQAAVDMVASGEIKNVNAIVALQWLQLNPGVFDRN